MNKILTTHVGSLPRPKALLDAFGKGAARENLPTVLRESINEIMARQLELGIDIVNDGEYGKAVRRSVDYGAWASYIYERLKGYEVRELGPGGILARSKERDDFAAFYAEDPSVKEPVGVRPRAMVCIAPVSYCGQDLVNRDLANLAGANKEHTFVTAVSPSSVEAMQPNAFYATQDEYGWAIATALREEYRAITAAGFTLQIDDPGLVVLWDWWFARDKSFAEYRKFAEARVEMLNFALAGIPEQQIRYHLCWGSWHGPHSTDVRLADIVDLVLKVNAGAYSLEAGNVRHERDWSVWRDAKLPAGKQLVPGVVSHSTNVVEHPELVAERIIQYANVVGRDNVIASTDCGLGGRVHAQIAWAKLGALVEGARIATIRLF
ncbi:MAG: cobalamin-independent methionine synthase II family protein [Burkholderiales bacterium]